jgi:hypothetical protein
MLQIMTLALCFCMLKCTHEDMFVFLNMLQELNFVSVRKRQMISLLVPWWKYNGTFLKLKFNAMWFRNFNTCMAIKLWVFADTGLREQRCRLCNCYTQESVHFPRLHTWFFLQKSFKIRGFASYSLSLIIFWSSTRMMKLFWIIQFTFWFGICVWKYMGQHMKMVTGK